MIEGKKGMQIDDDRFRQPGSRYEDDEVVENRARYDIYDYLSKHNNAVTEIIVKTP